MARSIYEAYTDDQTVYFTSNAALRSFMNEPDVKGDWESVEHLDVCELLQNKDIELREAWNAIERAALLMAQMLPMAHGKVDTTRYGPEEREAHNWIVKNAIGICMR